MASQGPNYSLTTRLFALAWSFVGTQLHLLAAHHVKLRRAAAALPSHGGARAAALQPVLTTLLAWIDRCGLGADADEADGAEACTKLAAALGEAGLQLGPSGRLAAPAAIRALAAEQPAALQAAAAELVTMCGLPKEATVAALLRAAVTPSTAGAFATVWSFVDTRLDMVAAHQVKLRRAAAALPSHGGARAAALQPVLAALLAWIDACGLDDDAGEADGATASAALARALGDAGVELVPSGQHALAAAIRALAAAQPAATRAAAAELSSVCGH
jgi:hypothetical protein